MDIEALGVKVQALQDIPELTKHTQPIWELFWSPGIRDGYGGLSNREVGFTAQCYGIADISRAVRLVEICEIARREKE